MFHYTNGSEISRSAKTLHDQAYTKQREGGEPSLDKYIVLGESPVCQNSYLHPYTLYHNKHPIKHNEKFLSGTYQILWKALIDF